MTIVTGGGGSSTTGAGILYTYALNEADHDNSLFHSIPTAGRAYAVAFGDSTEQDGSDGYWLALPVASYPPGGTFGYSQDATYGHIRDGAHAQFALIAPSRGVDIRAGLVKCDATHLTGGTYHLTGGTTGQTALIESLAVWAYRDKFPLRGGGNLRIDVGLSTGGASLLWGDMKLITDVGFNGWAVTGPGDIHDTEAYHVELFIWGDNGAFANSSTAGGFKGLNDAGALKTVKIKSAYLKTIFDLDGNSEDWDVAAYGEYCKYGFTVTEESTGPYTGSPDDNHIYLQLHNCDHYVWMTDGTDSSFDITFNCQNRHSSGDGIACIYPATGKNVRMGGFLRGHNGPEDCIQLYKDHGVSMVVFDDLVLEHGYYTGLNMKWVNRVTGTITLRDYCDDGATQCQSVVYGRIANAGGLRVIIEAAGVTNAIKYPARVCVDDNYFPVDCDLGELVVQRGSPEPTLPLYTSVTGTAIRLYKARNCSLKVLQCDGDVKTDSGLQAFNLDMPATWLVAKQGSYAFVVGHTAPQLQVCFRGACYSDDLFDESWLFAGVRAECVIDFDNAPFRYSLGYWDPVGTIRSSDVLLASRTSRFNANMGGEGVQVWDKTNNRPMWKSDTTQTAAWKDAASGNANTVIYQVITDTFMTTIGGFGGATAPAAASAEKDGIDIIFAGLADLGYTPTCMYWMAPTAAAAGTARNTPRSNMMNSATFGLTETGYSTSWSANVGYTGNGTSFKLTGLPDVSVGDGGLGLNSLFVGFMSTVHNASNTHVVAAINGKLKGRGKANGGGDFSVSTTATTDFSLTSGDAPMWTAFARYGASDTRGYRNDKLDVSDTTSSAAGGGIGGAPSGLVLFYETLAAAYSTETLNFFIMGPAPTDDTQAIGIARVIKRGLKKAGKVTW